MNVLLLFANIALFLSVIKDFLDTNWKWENKLILNISLFLISLLPTSFNLFVFISSTLPRGKVLLYNIIKCLTMDYFELYLSNRCFENNISFFGFKFGKWLFCNQATGKHEFFFGGKVLLVDPGTLFDKEVFKDIEDVNLILDFEILSDFLNIPNSNDFNMLFEEPNVNCKRFNKATANLLLKFLDEKHVIVKYDDWYYLKESKDDHVYNVLEELAIFYGGLYFKRTEKIVCWNELGFSDLMEFLEKVPIKAVFNRFNGFDLGMIKLYFNEFEDKNVYLSKTNITGSKSKILVENLNSKNFVRLYFIFHFWAQNKTQGVILDNLIKIGNGWIHPLRKGIEIMHCISPEEIIEYVLNDSYFYFIDYPMTLNYVEGFDWEQSFNNINEQYIVKTLGEDNSIIFRKLIHFHLKDTLAEKNLQRLQLLLIEMKTLRNINKVALELKNFQAKKIYTDVDYFFGLIGYNRFNGLDKKVPVSRFAAEVCRGHKRFQINKEAVVYGDNEFVNNMIKKSKDLEHTLEVETKAKAKRLAKKSLENYNNLIRIELSKNKMELKKVSVRTYKNVLLENSSGNDFTSMKVSSKILLEVNYNKENKKCGRKRTNKTKSLNYDLLIDKASSSSFVFDKKSFNLKPSNKNNKKSNSKNKDLNRESEFIKQKSPSKIFCNKNEKLFKFLKNELHPKLNFNRFSVLATLDEESKDYLKKEIPAYNIKMENFKKLNEKKLEEANRLNEEKKFKELKKQRESDEMMKKLKADQERTKKIAFNSKNFPSVKREEVNSWLCDYNVLIYNKIKGKKIEDNIIKNGASMFVFLRKLKDINDELNRGNDIHEKTLTEFENHIDESLNNKKLKKLAISAYELKSIVRSTLIENDRLIT